MRYAAIREVDEDEGEQHQRVVEAVTRLFEQREPAFRFLKELILHVPRGRKRCERVAAQEALPIGGGFLEQRMQLRTCACALLCRYALNPFLARCRTRRHSA